MTRGNREKNDMKPSSTTTQLSIANKQGEAKAGKKTSKKTRCKTKYKSGNARQKNPQKKNRKKEGNKLSEEKS